MFVQSMLLSPVEMKTIRMEMKESSWAGRLVSGYSSKSQTAPRIWLLLLFFLNGCGEDGGDDSCESGGDDDGGSDDLFCFENMPTR